ncbi:hypothetical protein ACLESD_20595 [Pyxidicoccus sp. 3LFB2]
MKWMLLLAVLGAGSEPVPPSPAPAPTAPKASGKQKAPAKAGKPAAKGKAAAEPAVPLDLPPPRPTTLKDFYDLQGEPEEDPAFSFQNPPPGVELPPIYRQPFTWDVPRVLDIIDVPGQMLANGIPVRLKAVRSAEKPEPLLQHIVDRWIEWGLFIPPPEQQKQTLQEVQLTAVDPERFITYTVILQPNVDGTTTLYLGEANLSKPPAAMSSVAPVYPGAEGVMTSDLEVVRSVNYSVRAKEAEVQAFYRTELGKAGFKEVQPGRFQGGQQEEVELILKPLQPGTLAVSVLRRTVAPEAPRRTGD